MDIHYKLRIFGDLHVGSGTGLPGVIDGFVVRDQDGFPQVPASQVKGIVRDNCAQLLKYLGRWSAICKGQKSWYEMTQLMRGVQAQDFCGMQGRELCVMCAIFGSPATPGGWWFSPATYSEDYRRIVKDADPSGQLGLARGDMSVSAHASINPETRRAQEDHLFNLEVVRVEDSQTLEGHIEPLTWDQPASAVGGNELLGWLTGAVLFTRRLGGRRRRGWGRCRFDLSEPVNDDAREALETLLGGSQ